MEEREMIEITGAAENNLKISGFVFPRNGWSC